MSEQRIIHGPTKENLLFAFPVGLRENQSIAALGGVTAEELAKRPEEIGRLALYSRIDELPEDLLDILAYDFKVDWWDPDYSLEEKRRIFKSSWYVHKHLGTKAAVETALRAIYPKAEVQEWFEYGGKPYFFRLNIDLTGEQSDAARPWRVLERVEFYKSLRSHVDEIVFNFVLPAYTLHVGGGVGAQASIGVPLEPDVYDATPAALRTGGGAGAQASIKIPPEPDEYNFRDTLRFGGRFSTGTELPVPEDPAQPTVTTILRTGGVCTIISNLSQGE